MYFQFYLRVLAFSTVIISILTVVYYPSNDSPADTVPEIIPPHVVSVTVDVRDTYTGNTIVPTVHIRPAHAYTKRQAAAFLTRATFGPKKSEVEALEGEQYQAWMDEQFSQPICYHLPVYDRFLAEQNIPVLVGNEALLSRMRARSDAWWNAAVNCDDQLRQRVAFALSQIFVVSENSTLRQHPRGLANYQDMLLRNAFGNFRALLEDVTLNPMMGEYLSMAGNRRESDDGSRLADENFAREIMQLFTIGLVELNTDGTPKLDASGNTIDTYDQEDVKSFARVFTGYTCAENTTFTSCSLTINNEVAPMVAFEDAHDKNQKTLLKGSVLPANQTAYQDLSGALDNLFYHPNVGPFISKQLIQRLVASNPSPAYVERVASVFNSNSGGERGDLRAVIEAILLDREATSMDGHYDDGKLKEPIIKLTSLWRAFDAKGINHRLRYMDGAKEFAQQPLRAPSVFNFFKPGYTEGAFSDVGLLCPECQIINESTIVSVNNRLRSYVLESWNGGGAIGAQRNKILLDFDELKTKVGDPAALIQEINARLFAYSMSDETRQILVDHVSNVENNEEKNLRLRDALLLAVSSPEFSVQY